MMPVRPERKVELEEYARRRGKDPADALDEALANYLEWDRQDHQEAVEGIRRAYVDVKTGRSMPADEVLAELRGKFASERG